MIGDFLLLSFFHNPLLPQEFLFSCFAVSLCEYSHITGVSSFDGLLHMKSYVFFTFLKPFMVTHVKQPLHIKGFL